MGRLRLALRTLVGIGGVTLALAAGGCADTNNLPPDATQVALVLPSGLSLVDVAWVVQAPDGSTVASGTEEIGIAQATVSLGLVLPVGHGDVLTLDALTADGADCSGASAPFDVAAGVPASIGVSLTCQTSSYAPGGCPDVLVQGPTPPTAETPSGTVSVVATASPLDGSAPSYAWAATGGAFGDTNGGSTLYTCRTPGVQTIFVTLSYPPGAGCSTTFLLPVTCLP